MYEVLDVTDHVSGTEIVGLSRKVNRVQNFIDDEKMELNLKKCNGMVIDFRRNKTIIPPLVINGHHLKESHRKNRLDYGVDDDLKWKSNVEYLVKKAAKCLFLLKVLKSYNAPTQDLNFFYIYIIRSTLEYCAQL
jgi:hypothetical protein